MTSKLAQRLIDNEARLVAAWGDALPAVTPAVIANADRAVALGGKATEPGPGWMSGLNPHTLGDLAAAFRHTKDARYAAVVRDYIGFWMDKELDAGGKWTAKPNLDVLMIPHRLGDTECIGWFGALPHVLESGLFDDAFLERLVEMARQQYQHVAGGVFEGRNIRMTQGDGLYTGGERLNWLAESTRWRELGLEVLNDAFNRQVGPDGTGEASGWYHYIEANMALRYWRLGRARPDLTIQLTAERVGRMFDYVAGSVEPAGYLNRIGDCTAGMPPDNRLSSVLDRHKAICRELGRPETPPTGLFFPHAQQAFLRTDWTDRADYLTFDATRRYGYHWHPSLNAIQFHIAGQRVLADPGRMSYNDTPQRRYACSTSGHNTMNLNGMNQTHVRPIVRYRAAEGCDLIDSSYQGGYWDDAQSAGIFGEHHRTVLWIRVPTGDGQVAGRMVVVLDHMLHHQVEGGKPTIQCNWQFAPGKVTLDAAGKRVHSEHGPARMMMLFPLQPAGGEMELHEGRLDGGLCAGWAADVSDKPVPAPQLRCAWRAFDPWNFDHATVLLPYQDRPPQVSVERVQTPEGHKGTGRFALAWADGSRDEFWWKRRLEFAMDNCGDFTTDSAMVHLRIDPSGKVSQALVFDGSYLKPFTKSMRQSPETFIYRP